MVEKSGKDNGVRPLCQVILITGFLGTGKTTLLRHILQWPGDLSKTALLVNEFGRVGIDGELLQGSKTPMVELTSGCICCSLQSDLLKAIEEILDAVHPERLLIEASGVANPFEILRLLSNSNVSPRLSPPLVVTVFDADLWEAKECFGPLFFDQIKAADLFLFNKIDLLPKDDIPKCLEEIREINQGCSIIPTYFGQIDPEVLWTPSMNQALHPAFNAPDLVTPHGSAEELGYITFAFEEKVPFKEDCFRRFMEGIPLELFRVKGFALFKDKRFFLNHVGGKTEWVKLNQRGPTRLAFTGWKVDEEEVLNQVKACLRDV